MYLNCDDTNPGGDRQIEPGVFVAQGTIEEVGVLTGDQPPNWTRPIGLGVQLTLVKEGLSFKPEVKVFGDPKLDASGNTVGWGSAFPVRDLLNRIAGYRGVIGSKKDPLEIPRPALLKLIGKPVFYLRYAYKIDESTSKMKYACWNRVSDSADDLARQWIDSRKNGFPKSFTPPSNGNQPPAVTATVASNTPRGEWE